MGEDKHHADYSNYNADLSKEEMLQQVVDSYSALSESTNWVSNLSNCSSLLWYGYHSVGIPVNWSGFYVKDHSKSIDSKVDLILGPFQGKVACQTIEYGKGVCGTAISTGVTQTVKDVNKFPGHIACDGGTQSEIVVPIIKKGEKLGVLDIDCLDLNGFDETDEKYLQELVNLIVETCEF